MRIRHSTLALSGHTLHHIDFDPATFREADLRWLPHAARLAGAGRKRKSEHLAGRLAAAHALRDYGVAAIPDIGERRQPLWPAGLYGSISHCGKRALAVAAHRPIGVDIEQLFTPALTAELAEQILSAAERAALEASGLAAELALTLAFSAKESLFKAHAALLPADASFLSLRINALDGETLSLRLAERLFRVVWRRSGAQVITLCA